MSVTDGQKAAFAPEPLTVSPANIAYTVASARLAADLDPGIYRLACTTDCFWLQGTSAVTAVVLTSNFLGAGQSVHITVTGTANARVAFVRSAADGHGQAQGPL